MIDKITLTNGSILTPLTAGEVSRGKVWEFTSLHRHSFNTLVNLILRYGEHYPKKHGKWIRLHYINDYYFCVDSWNRATYIIKNARYNNEYTGFSGEEVMYLGGDWGGFFPKVDEELVEFYINNLTVELKERGVAL